MHVGLGPQEHSAPRAKMPMVEVPAAAPEYDAILAAVADALVQLE